MMPVSVGQTVLVSWSHRSRDSLSELSVKKVGRKWIHLTGGYRFDESMSLDGAGHSSPGRVYLSRDDYERKVREDAEWAELRAAVESHKRRGYTAEQVRYALDALRAARNERKGTDGQR